MTSGFQCSTDGCAPIEQPHPHPQQHDPVSDKTSEKLKGVLAEEIADIVKDGISIPILQQLHRFANIAQELLMVRSPIADVHRRQRSSGALYSTPSNITIGGSAVGTPYAPYGSYDDCEPLTQEAAPNETYGAKLIREIVPALSALKDGGKKSKLESLVSAIAEAKENGLDDIAETLEATMQDLLARKYLEEADEEISQEDDGDASGTSEDADIAIGSASEWGTPESPEIQIGQAPDVTTSAPPPPGVQ